MKRKRIITSDGSHSLFVPGLDEHYHSKHGAVQEAYHVFIRKGLDLFENGSDVHILEIGFGTGLNALITFSEAIKRNLKIYYTAVEAYPVPVDEALMLNYPEVLKHGGLDVCFKKMHEAAWDEPMLLSENFTLIKQQRFFQEITAQNCCNLIYFDAFGARVQPELWTVTIFKKMIDALKYNGILVTYAAKGSVRRAMQEVGFKVERLPGPPGKREMLRAIKN